MCPYTSVWQSTCFEHLVRVSIACSVQIEAKPLAIWGEVEPPSLVPAPRATREIFTKTLRNVWEFSASQIQQLLILIS